MDELAMQMAMLETQLEEATLRLIEASRDAPPELNRAVASVLRRVANRIEAREIEP